MGLSDFCVTHSGRIVPYPEVVVKRNVTARIEPKSSAPARIAAYENVSQNDRYYMLAAGYGANGKRRRSTRRELAQIAVNAGFASAVRVAAAAFRRVRRWTR